MSLATALPQPIQTTAARDPERTDSTQSRSRNLRAVPSTPEARGFALYVGLDEEKARQAGTSLGAIVEAVKKTIDDLAPAAQSYAAVALAPEGAGGRDVDVVRLALQEPSASAHQSTESEEAENQDRARSGVVIDISRKRVTLDNAVAALTYKEFELLQYLVLREGRTIERAELIGALWSAADDETPNDRTVDVHVRRLRSKLGDYDDVVRTVRGRGYRFDRHADVTIRHASTPSPDLF